LPIEIYLLISLKCYATIVLSCVSLLTLSIGDICLQGSFKISFTTYSA